MFTLLIVVHHKRIASNLTNVLIFITLTQSLALVYSTLAVPIFVLTNFDNFINTSSMASNLKLKKNESFRARLG